jgi:hypothetical protein
VFYILMTSKNMPGRKVPQAQRHDDGQPIEAKQWKRNIGQRGGIACRARPAALGSATSWLTVARRTPAIR